MNFASGVFALVLPPVLGTGIAAASIYTMSVGRLGAIVAGLLALTGAVIGGRSLVRRPDPVGAGNRRRDPIVALATGLAGTALAGSVAATAAGGIGTGNGLGGAIVAMVAGLIAMVLGGLALVRSRRAD